jgi:hypothetical protein
MKSCDILIQFVLVLCNVLFEIFSKYLVKFSMLIFRSMDNTKPKNSNVRDQVNF